MKRGYIYVGLAVLLWGSTAAVSKILLANLNNLQVLLFTSLFATIGLFIITIIQRKTVIIKEYTLKDYLTFAYMGFLGIFLYFFFLYGAITFLPAHEAFIINYLWPVMVVIFAIIILKEKLDLSKIIGIILSFIGVFLVISKGNIVSVHFDSIKGIAFAILGSISYGLFSVLGKKLHYEKFTSMMFCYLFSFIFTLIAVLLYSSIPKVSLAQLMGLIWLGIFTSGLAFVFWFLALKYGETAQMSNVVFLTPFVSLIYIHFILGEKIALSSIIGLSFIIGGILVQTLIRPLHKKNEVSSAVDIKS